MIVKYLNESLIDLRNSINSREIPENKNPKKIVNIVEKILEFTKQQKGKGIEIFFPKKMLQRLPIALAQVKAGNTSKKEKEVTKKVYKNIMNSSKYI